MNDYDDSEDCSSNNAFRARSNTWPLNRPDIIVPGGICIDEALPEIELEDDDLFTTNENWSSGFDHDIMSWDPLLNAQNQHASTNNITGPNPQSHQQQQHLHHHHHHHHQQQQQQHHHHHHQQQPQQQQQQQSQNQSQPQDQTQTQQQSQHTQHEQAQQHHHHHAPYHLQESSSSAPAHLQQHSLHHPQQPQQHQAQTHHQQQLHHPHHESYHPQQAAAATQQMQHLTLSEHFHHQHLQQQQQQQQLPTAQQLAQDENFSLSESQQLEDHFALQTPNQHLANHHHQSQHSLHLSHQPHHPQHHLVGSPVLGDGLANVEQELVELEPPDSLNSATNTEALVHSLQQNDDNNIGNKQSNSNAGSKTKLNTPRRNAWGNMSYADLISQAINSTNDKRLTLSQIYDWMVQHVPYFKDKGDSNSSAGWKNSVRHNLSLHNRFKRLQNEGTGKSSWWTINPEANVGKCARRRAASMEASKYEKKRGRAKKRAEAVRQGLVAYPSLTNSSLNGSTSALDQPLTDQFDAQTQQHQSHQPLQPQQPQTQQQPARPRSSQAHRHNHDAEGSSSSNIHNGQPGLYITSRSDSQYESTDNMMQQQQQPPYFMPFTMNV